MLNFRAMNPCDAGRSGGAAFAVYIPRGKLTKREEESGAQPCARLLLCTIHAQNVLDKDKNARAHELRGWLDAEPCNTDYSDEETNE